jgi:hypothetical protein
LCAATHTNPQLNPSKAHQLPLGMLEAALKLQVLTLLHIMTMAAMIARGS